MSKKKKQYTPKKRKTIFNVSMNYVNKRTSKDLPNMYSAVALALWELVEGDEIDKYNAIMEMIEKSSEIWNDVAENGKDINAECEKVTGINIRNHVC